MAEIPTLSMPRRLPTGTRVVHSWPSLFDGPLPAFDPHTWDLSLFPVPLLHQVKRWTWPEIQQLPRTRVLADWHSIDGWSKLDCFWEGVTSRDLLAGVSWDASVRSVMIHAEMGLSTNLPLEIFLGEGVLFALKLDGSLLLPEQGAPLRLVVPGRWSYKCPLWVRGIELMTDNRPGFWESQGLPLDGHIESS